MKKLLEFLAIFAISSPVFFNDSFLRLQNIKNNYNLKEKDLPPKKEKWGNLDYIKFNEYKELDSITVFQGTYKSKIYDFFLKTDIKNKSIKIFISNDDQNYKWEDFIINIDDNGQLIYREIFVYKNNLYIANKSVNGNRSVLYYCSLEKILKDYEDNKGPINFNNIKKDIVSKISLDNPIAYAFFDAKSNILLLGEYDNNVDLYELEDKGKEILELNVGKNAYSIKDFRNGIRIKRIFWYTLNTLGKEENFIFTQGITKENKNIIFLLKEKNGIVFDNPEITAIDLYDKDNLLLGVGNKIYKAPFSHLINQEGKINLNNLNFVEFEEINEFGYLTFIKKSENLEFLSDKGAGFVEKFEFGQKGKKIRADFFTTKLNLLLTMPIKVSTKVENKWKYNLYFLKDDNSGVAYLRDYIEINEIKIAYNKAIDAEAVKNDIFKIIKDNNKKINIKEQEWIKNNIDIPQLNPGKTINDWYKEERINLSNTFIKSDNAIISSYDISVFDSLKLNFTPNVNVVKGEKIEGDKLKQIFDYVEERIGKFIEIKEKPKALSVVDNKAQLSIKVKDNLILNEKDKKWERNIDIKFTPKKISIEGKFSDSTCDLGLFKNEEFIYFLKNWNEDVNNIELSKNAKNVEIKSKSQSKDNTGAEVTLKVNDKAKVNDDVIIEFESNDNYDVSKDYKKIKILDNKIIVNNFKKKLSIGKSNKIIIKDFKLYKNVKVSLLEKENLNLNDKANFSNFSNIEWNYNNKNGELTIKAIKIGKPIKIVIEAECVRNNIIINKFEETFEVIAKKAFPIWAIVIICLILFGLLGVLAWFLWLKFRVDNFHKSQPRYAAIVADQNAVSKAKKTSVAKAKREQGILRSGLFKRDLDYNNEKLNDPDYQNKFVNLENNPIEDNQPIINNWNEKNISKNSEKIVKDPKLESRLDKVKKRSEDRVNKINKKALLKTKKNNLKSKSNSIKVDKKDAKKIKSKK